MKHAVFSTIFVNFAFWRTFVMAMTKGRMSKVSTCDFWQSTDESAGTALFASKLRQDRLLFGQSFPCTRFIHPINHRVNDTTRRTFVMTMMTKVCRKGGMP